MNAPLVIVIDDDESVRESLPDLLRQFGFAACAFVSAEGFLNSAVVERARCLVLDIDMPGTNGPALKEELTRRGLRIPVVFITGRVDEPARTRLIQGGAVDVLVKPFADEVLLRAVRKALRLPP